MADEEIKEEEIKHMDLFEKDLEKLCLETKLTPLGVAAVLLKNAMRIYGNTIDRESLEMLVDFAMDNHAPSENIGKATVH